MPLVYSEDGSRIIVSFEESFEKRQILTITMLKKSQEIAKKYNKQTLKIAQLLKVWQIYRVYESKGINTLTDKDLRKYINLSQSQLTDIKKMLKKENIVKIDREGNYNMCLGSNFMTNVFYDNKK